MIGHEQGVRTLIAPWYDFCGLGDQFFSDDFWNLTILPRVPSEEKGVGGSRLIDEGYKSDEAFEAFLLEIIGLTKFSIPELGSLRQTLPLVFLLLPTISATFDAPRAVVSICTSCLTSAP